MASVRHPYLFFGVSPTNASAFFIPSSRKLCKIAIFGQSEVAKKRFNVVYVGFQ
jgi:hypothetical protein